jgi:predicted DNA-binding mobile mystery protein A
MKLKRNILHLQRHQLDELFQNLKSLPPTPRPRLGWLKAIRESLGITARQLAALLGTDSSAVLGLEERELKGTVTLESIERAARAMGCQLVYSIVPMTESLEQIVDQKAHAAASRLLKSVAHSMHLEKQDVSKTSTAQQIETLAQELKASLDPVLWEK